MPKKSTKIKVIKIARRYDLDDISQNFSFEPIMYLELLENEAKVIPELIGIEYVPQDIPEEIEEEPIESPDKVDKPEIVIEEGEQYSPELDNVEITEEPKDKIEEKVRDILSKKDYSDEEDLDLGKIKTKKTAPKLSQIDNGEININGKKGKNLTNAQINEEEANKRRELLWKFDILKRKYKGADVPKFSEYSDLDSMQRSYDDVIRRLSLDSTVTTYKKYLMSMFMAIEWGAQKINIDMKDYTKQQSLNMNEYDSLLIEIGEKNWIHPDKSWSPYTKLLFMVTLNTGIFLFTKYFFQSLSPNVFGDLASGGSTETPKKKGRKMKGPPKTTEESDDDEVHNIE